MRALNRFNLIAAALLAATLATPSFAQNDRGAPPQRDNVVDVLPGAIVPGQYIVVLKDDVGNPAAVANEMARTHGLALGVVYSHALKGFAAQVPAGAVNALSRDPRVKYIEADQTARAFAQKVPTGIRRIFADGNTNGNKNLTIDGHDDWRIDVDVAVIDTGIDNHPDLNTSSTRNVNCSGGSPLIATCTEGSAPDGNGHGTHVSGTIGALDNDFGVVGVAPGARLWGVKVLKDSGSGYYSWIIAGIDWVTANGGTNGPIRVANMSLGGGSSTALCDAISNSVSAGVTHVVAAGNSATDAKDTSPANCPDAITVSALADFNGLPGGGGAATCRTDQDDTLADFSNYGPVVAIAAPGVCIESTWTGGGYNTISGTSMASPHVAGAAALLASGITDPVEIKNAPGVIKIALLDNGNLGWTDTSPDDIQEPLLDVSSAVFAPATVAGSESGTTTNTAPSASIHNPTTTVTGIVTVQIAASDVDNNFLTVEWSLDNGAYQSTIYNSTTGYYEADWNTTLLTNGTTHTVDARASDGIATTNAPTANVTVDNSPSSGATTVGVASLSCRVYGGGKNLDITLIVKDDLGAPVGGASVAVNITRDLGGLWSVLGTTASDGSVVFAFKRAAKGTYTTKVNSITASPDWDEIQPSPNTCKL